MKTNIVFLAFLLFSLPAFSRPIVLIGHYDAFGSSSFNNSEKVAKDLAQRMQNSNVHIKLCALNTVFDKAYAQIADCLKELDERPAMVIGLGEAGCNLKAEMAMRNFDRTMGPDNEGNERRGEIIPGAAAFVALRYPLPQMYCALSEKERKSIDISNNAGSFVCNNTGYQLAHNHPELQFGFIHVPSSGCRGLERKSDSTLQILETMIIKGTEYLQTEFIVSPNTPHSSNELRLPITKGDIKEIKDSYSKNDPCLKDFFKRAKGVDERRFWSFLDPE